MRTSFVCGVRDDVFKIRAPVVNVCPGFPQCGKGYWRIWKGKEGPCQGNDHVFIVRWPVIDVAGDGDDWPRGVGADKVQGGKLGKYVVHSLLRDMEIEGDCRSGRVANPEGRGVIKDVKQRKLCITIQLIKRGINPERA